MRATVLSAYSLLVFTFKTPLKFMLPESTVSPTVLSAGRLSPVSAEVSTLPAPSITVPSRGILSPGFRTIISPISTSSGSTSCSLPSLRTTAYSGLISISAAIDFLLFPTAIDWNHSPI